MSRLYIFMLYKRGFARNDRFVKDIKKQYINLQENIKNIKDKSSRNEIEIELTKTRRRINILCKKISKIQQYNTNLDACMEKLDKSNTIINFVDE